MSSEDYRFGDEVWVTCQRAGDVLGRKVGDIGKVLRVGERFVWCDFNGAHVPMERHEIEPFGRGRAAA
jgi:hypothetical protein